MVTIVCWVIFAACIAYIVHFRLPRVARGKNLARLRQEALGVFDSIEMKDWEQRIFRPTLMSEKVEERLRAYVRFKGEFRPTDVAAAYANLRYARTRFMTAMNPSTMSEHHMRVFCEFHDRDGLRYELAPETDDKKVLRRFESQLTRTLWYAASHADQTEKVMTIVRERGVYRLKDIKDLLKNMDEAPAAALSDGML
jgi:hypothetical protein